MAALGMTTQCVVPAKMPAHSPLLRDTSLDITRMLRVTGHSPKPPLQALSGAKAGLHKQYWAR